MAQRTSKNVPLSPREERIKHLVPAPPGSFVVYYEIQPRRVVRLPIVAWGVREREEWRFRGDDSDHVVCDYVEAMVPEEGTAEAVFAEDRFDLDEEGSEVYRTLGVTQPGDGTDWDRQMQKDIAAFESVSASRVTQRPPKMPAKRPR
jgi:hypothetical protein